MSTDFTPGDEPIKFTIAYGATVTASGNYAYENYGTLLHDGEDFFNNGVLDNYGKLNNISGVFGNSSGATINNHSDGIIDNSGHILDRGVTDKEGNINIGVDTSNKARWDVHGSVTNSGVVNINYESKVSTAKDSIFTIEKDGKVKNQGYWPNSGELRIYGLLHNNNTYTFFDNEHRIDIYPDGKLINEGRFVQNGTFINNGFVQSTSNSDDGQGFYNWGYFAGSGTNSGTFHQEGGKFAPGNSAGGFIVDGDFYHNGGVKEIELGGTFAGRGNPANSDYDWIHVTGDLTIDGGSLDISLIDGFKLDDNQEFIISKVDGELIGQFSGLSEGDSVGQYDSIGAFGTQQDLYITYQAGESGNDIGLYTRSLRKLPVIDRNVSSEPSPPDDNSFVFTEFNDTAEQQKNFDYKMLGGDDLLRVIGGIKNFANGNRGNDRFVILGGEGSYRGGKDQDTFEIFQGTMKAVDGDLGEDYLLIRGGKGFYRGGDDDDRIEVLGAEVGTEVNGNGDEDYITGTVAGVIYRGGQGDDLLEVSQGDVFGDKGADTFRGVTGAGFAVVNDYTIGDDVVEVSMQGSWNRLNNGLMFTDDLGDQIMFLVGINNLEQVTLV